MTEPTEPRTEQATPARWIERLEIFRERFRIGLIDEQKFKDILRSFQFRDQVGHLWMPGATTDQWYRWDRTQWTAAEPPAQLTASAIPLALSVAWGRGLPNAQVQPTLPANLAAPGVTLQPSVAANVPPPLETIPAPPVSFAPPSAPSQSAAPANTPSPLPKAMPVPPKSAMPLDLPEQGTRRPATALPPSDLPERGATASRHRPTDLPR